MATEQVTFILRVPDTTGREWGLQVSAEVEMTTEEIEGEPVTTVGSIKLDPSSVTGRIVAE
jgi:hypothetical protein